MKRKYVYITILIAIVCLTMGLVAFGMKGAKEVNTTEPPTEPATEPSTEASTESPTEAPTEAPTEPATEVPTEAPTEASSEPEIEIAIQARDTMLEGAPVEFDVVYEDVAGVFSYEKLQQTMKTALIKDGSEYDYKRVFNIFVARSIEEFKSHFSARNAYAQQQIEEYIEKYNESYFEKNVVLMLYRGGRVDEIVKNGAELSIGASTRLDKPDDGTTVSTTEVKVTAQFIEVSKADLDGVDTISFFVQAANW